MLTKELVLALLTTHSSAGATKFSVESADYCMRAFPPASCTVPTKHSSFYNGWVHQERLETALARYEKIVEALDDVAKELLCRDDSGRDEDCVPYVGEYDFGGPRYWSLLSLETAGAAVGLLESGYREDVQVGRGRSGKPSDDGGEGRGPANEACFIQAHPKEAWRFASGPDPVTLARAELGDAEAQEAVMQTMLGREPEKLRECWRVGLKMLIHSRAYCQWWLGANKVKADGDFAMFSMYGTGNSCTSGNGGKTALRVAQFRSFYGEASEKRRLEAKNK